jgi:hypothetical protein
MFECCVRVQLRRESLSKIRVCRHLRCLMLKHVLSESEERSLKIVVILLIIIALPRCVKAFMGEIRHVPEYNLVHILKVFDYALKAKFTFSEVYKMLT